MKLVTQVILLFLFVWSQVGCSSTSEKNTSNLAGNNNVLAKINTNLFDSSHVEVVQPDDIFNLTEQQQTEFLTYYNEQLKLGIKPHKALSKFLQDRLTNFTYYGQTMVAEKAMRLNKGNCMSLAILTSALAKVVGLKVEYQQVHTMPVFEKHENVLLSSSHVQAVIYDPTFVEEEGMIYFKKPGIVIDYFPQKSNIASSKIQKESLYAQYYTNIAAEAVIDEDLDAAFVNASMAYQQNKFSAAVNNLLAVLHKRKGDVSTAELFYKQAISYDEQNLYSLLNYAVLLRYQQRFDELSTIEGEIDKLDDPNPYRWLEQAYIAHRENRNRIAEKYYLKVIEKAPYVKQAYLGLYQIYLKGERIQKAKSILKKGLEWTYAADERMRYKRKLYSLNKL